MKWILTYSTSVFYFGNNGQQLINFHWDKKCSIANGSKNVNQLGPIPYSTMKNNASSKKQVLLAKKKDMNYKALLLW